MDIKSTAGERLKTYLEGLSEKQRRGILVAMLAFTCVASGIVLLRAAGRLTPARERMELPFGEGSLADTLRRLPDPLKGQVTSINRFDRPAQRLIKCFHRRILRKADRHDLSAQIPADHFGGMQHAHAEIIMAYQYNPYHR